jgi:hypothetical protein
MKAIENLQDKVLLLPLDLAIVAFSQLLLPFT